MQPICAPGCMTKDTGKLTANTVFNSYSLRSKTPLHCTTLNQHLDALSDVVFMRTPHVVLKTLLTYLTERFWGLRWRHISTWEVISNHGASKWQNQIVPQLYPVLVKRGTTGHNSSHFLLSLSHTAHNEESWGCCLAGVTESALTRASLCYLTNICLLAVLHPSLQMVQTRLW